MQAGPSVIGWQIDNELNCELSEFYSESDTLAFREFLKKKYRTLEQLNEAWGTVFWNQTYTDWEEVYVPRTTCNDSTNPHEVMDYFRFISDSCCAVCKDAERYSEKIHQARRLYHDQRPVRESGQPSYVRGKVLTL